MPSNIRDSVEVESRPTASTAGRKGLLGLFVALALVLPPAASGSPAPPVNETAPTVTGTPTVGAALTASPGTWSPAGHVQTSIQWERCTSATSCQAILGATQAVYVVALVDAGAMLRITVTATNESGSTIANSAMTGAVTGQPPPHGSAPVSTAEPVLSGAAEVGRELTSTYGSWTGTAPISISLEWRRCDTTGSACAAIPGATSASYTLTVDDLGKTVRSVVTAVNFFGSVTAVSIASAVVGAVAMLPPDGVVPGIGIQRLGSSYGGASGYGRYSYVIVGRSAAPAAALQPGVSLVYQSGTSVNVGFDTGVPYTVAEANRWLLRDASGTLLRNLAYPGNFIGDVGDPGYQAEWARRVGDYLVSARVDGVYIDDVIADINAMSGRYPAKYPDQVSWENAMASFVSTVGSTLKARGFYVLVNAHKWIAGSSGSDDGSLEAQWWRRLAPFVSGLQSEYWVQDPTNIGRLRATGGEWWNNWEGWQQLVAVAQSAGADFFAYMYGGSADTRTMRYGKGSFMLDWDGRGGAFSFATSDGSDPWNTAWTADLGRPAAAKQSPAPGVWTRRFERGTVVVNSTGSTVTVTADGSPRTLGPTDALFLSD